MSGSPTSRADAPPALPAAPAAPPARPDGPGHDVGHDAGQDIRHDVDLAPLTTFGVRAIARSLHRLTAAGRIDAVLEAVAAESQRVGRPPVVLGGGSNLLFARDVDEPVLHVLLPGRRLVDDDGDTVEVAIAAGESWHDTVRWTLVQGWYGLENLALIPGRVGAAPWQNIGAYGVEVGERIAAVEAVDLQTGRRADWPAEACAFGYRSSRFKDADGRRWLITGVRLRLSRRPDLRLGYGELAAALPAGAGPVDVADAVEAIRRRKLPDPARLGNAGSFFKNPVVPAAAADALRAGHPALPCWPAGAGTVKLSAGWLIEAAGWKGRRLGAAGVSDRHALVLVNHGGASGRDIVALAERIQQAVGERFGVRLEPEPVIIR